MLIEGNGNMNLFSNCRNGNSSSANQSSTQRQVKFHSETVQKSWKKKISSCSDDGKNEEAEWCKIEDYLKRNPHMLTQFVVNNVSKSQLQNWESQLMMTHSNNCNDQEHKIPISTKAPNSDHKDTGQAITNNGVVKKVRRASIDNNVCPPSSPSNLPPVGSMKVTPSPPVAGGGTRSLRKASTGSQSAAAATNQSNSDSKPSSGAATPIRKISAQEFDRGELDELPVIDQHSRSFITEDGELTSSSKSSSSSKQQQSWNEQEVVDQEQLMTELVKDIANELDNRLLYHKILQNLCKLTNADRASLYLVEGDKTAAGDSPYLYDALSNVTKSSEISQVMTTENNNTTGAAPTHFYPPVGGGIPCKIPFGVGIVGLVAKTGQTINISDAYQDPRFDSAVDAIEDYKSKSILCVPILNVNQQVIGVARGVNKGGEANPQPFDPTDIRIFRTYLAFCGICLINAQLYNRSRLESKRSKVLLEMAKCVFEEQSTVETSVNRIMRELLAFLYCDRCSVAVFTQAISTDKIPPTAAAAGIPGGHPSLALPPENVELLLSKAKTFHLSLADLSRSEKTSLETTAGTTDSNSAATAPSCEHPTPAKNFPFYTEVVKKCLQSKSESMVNLNKISCDPVYSCMLSSVETGFCPESVLCSAIRDSQGDVIGIVQLVNKPDVGFTKADEHFMEAFVIFCGLGITNTNMYEQSVELSNKQKIAVEMLSYYTSANESEVRSVLSHAHYSRSRSFSSLSHLMSSSSPSHASTHTLDAAHPSQNTQNNNNDSSAAGSPQDTKGDKGTNHLSPSSSTCPLPCDNSSSTTTNGIKNNNNSVTVERKVSSSHWIDIHDFRLDELKLSEAETLSSALAMFQDLDLIKVLKIDEKLLVKWLITTKKNYRQVTYHNWRHAYSVCQLMFASLTTGNLKQHFSPLQEVALLLATLSHDLDHRGTNNSFQKLIESPLAQLYSTSTLERHHFDRFRTIISEGDCNILSNLTPQEFDTVINQVKHAIISTDLAVYFRTRGQFFDAVQNQCFDMSNTQHFDLLCSMLMTASDLGAITRPWHVEYQIANMIADEFFEQGDLERELYNKSPIPMFDRNKQDEIPKLQLSFIDGLCMPVYKHLALLFPSLTPLLDGVQNNRDHWSRLAEEIESKNNNNNATKASDG